MNNNFRLKSYLSTFDKLSYENDCLKTTKLKKKVTRRKTDCDMQITDGRERGLVWSTAIHGTPTVTNTMTTVTISLSRSTKFKTVKLI